MNEAFERLLNFNEPLDVNLLDQVVEAFYGSVPKEQREQLQAFLNAFREHPSAWTRVDTILEQSNSQKTRFFAMQILESCIQYRWKALPQEQREGIKQFLVNLIVRFSSNEEVMKKEKTYLSKLNMSLVQILKHEWPHNWEAFIPQIVESGRNNEILCENNMRILELLSEEIFDFSQDKMTSGKIQELKHNLTQQFALIYQFCEWVLQNSKKPSLLNATLAALLKYLSWIPLPYIFETQLVNMLVSNFFMNPTFQSNALQCLTEIGSVVAPNYEQKQLAMYQGVVNGLKVFVQPNNNPPLSQLYNQSEVAQMFIRNLALFFTGFFKKHLLLAEQAPQFAVDGMVYLCNISQVEDEEVFKICLDYWNQFAEELYQQELHHRSAPPLLLMSGGIPGAQMPSQRTLLYQQNMVLSMLRRIMIERMHKPEEVLVVVDENGEVVREHLTDVEAVALHKTMRETLVFLTHLDFHDTEQIMIDKLAEQVGSNWSKQPLSTLCWAIGSISGAMREDEEKQFLVSVIKDLLGLCEMTRGKDNKAIIASNIMYVVGQYPRFLKAHWKFLKTVVKKLFEFMHELHPGVQDMACETFLKISQRCRYKFVRSQQGEVEPFIKELLGDLPNIIADLETHQIYMFYEAVGHMISAESVPQSRDMLLQGLFMLPNRRWAEILSSARFNPEVFKQPETMREIVKILTTNVRVATSLGPGYIPQLMTIYEEMLQLYRMYSEMIAATVAQQGHASCRSSHVQAMRAVKRETLRLVTTVVEKSGSEDIPRMVQHVVPPLMDPVLGDYHRNTIADAKDAEVLSLFAAIINKVASSITEFVPRIFEAVFESTLTMITKNFEDHPDHRINFFRLLQAINQHCFVAFFHIPPHHFKLVIDSIVWAFKHRERNIAETGLAILLDMLRNVEQSGDVANQFYATFFLSLVNDIFTVLTDTLHKSGFKLQAAILMHCMHRVASGAITVPLYDAAMNPGVVNNDQFIRQYMLQLLSSAFPNIGQIPMQQFVHGLFDLNMDASAFKMHLRDFLVTLKEFSVQDNSELYLEEQEQQKQQELMVEQQRLAAVPGLLPASQRPDETQPEDML